VDNEQAKPTRRRRLVRTRASKFETDLAAFSRPLSTFLSLHDKMPAPDSATDDPDYRTMCVISFGGLLSSKADCSADLCRLDELR
jgi:hypothetical protein